MPRLKARGQGTGAPGHLQLVQRPAGTGRSEGRDADVADRLLAEQERLELWERPAGTCVGKNHELVITDLLLLKGSKAKAGQPTKDMLAGEAEWRRAQTLHIGKASSC